MDTGQIAQSYNILASHWDSDKFNRKNGLEQHKRALNFSDRTGVAIDIGCGSSGRIIDFLLDNGFDVEGLDISEGMIELARLRHPEIQFHHVDVVTWSPPREYQFISAWDSVWHVPLKYQKLVLEKLCGALAANGVIILSSGGVDEAGDGSNPFLGQPLYHAALGIPSLLRIVDRCGMVCRHLEYDEAQTGNPGKHLSVIFQKLPG